MNGQPDDNCIFCRIASGAVPAEEAYSGPLAYGFHDLNPTAPLHVLVVPRQHVRDVSQVRPEHAEVLAEMFAAARQVAAAHGYAESGYRLVFNLGQDAGMSVPHLHMHVLGGRRMAWPPG